MIDLERFVEKFFRQAVEKQFKSSREGKQPVVERDQTVVEAIRDRTSSDREKILKSWLQSYQVFRGIKKDVFDQIVSSIIKFADTRSVALSSYKDPFLLSEFNRLREKFRIDRDLPSLTSKALWACYPKCVPIYDRFAKQGLSTLCRLTDIDSPIRSQDKKYERYVDCWAALYERCLPHFEGRDRQGYPYDVRIFDKMLWLERYAFRLVHIQRFGNSRRIRRA